MLGRREKSMGLKYAIQTSRRGRLRKNDGHGLAKQSLLTMMTRYLKIRKSQEGLILDVHCRDIGRNRDYVIRKIGRPASYHRLLKDHSSASWLRINME